MNPGTRIGLAAGCTVLAVAVGTTGWLALPRRHGGQPQAAAAPASGKSSTKPRYGTRSGGIHYGPLGKLLLPEPEGYGLGPDLSPFGADAELSSAQAVRMLKQSDRHLPAAERAAADADVDKLHVKGIGLRSYQNDAGTLVIDVQIVQMNKNFARFYTRFVRALVKDSGGLSAGPRIKGHDAARCYYVSSAKSKIDDLSCVANEGDLLVLCKAAGPRRLDQKAVADLLRKQLDRIADPGESV